MTNDTKAEKKDKETTTLTFVPAVDIMASNDETILVADMPGVDEKSAEALLEDNVLILRGKRQVDAPSEFTVIRAEHAPTEYRRTFEVSHEIDRSKIKAAVKNGVLRVILPRAERAKPKKIEISTN